MPLCGPAPEFITQKRVLCVCVCFFEKNVWLSVSSRYIIQLLSELHSPIPHHAHSMPPRPKLFLLLNFAVSGTLWKGRHRSRHVVMRNKAKRNKSLLLLIAHKQKTILCHSRERERCLGSISGPWLRDFVEVIESICTPSCLPS